MRKDIKELNAAQKKEVDTYLEDKGYEIRDHVLYNRQGFFCEEKQIYNLGENIGKSPIFSDTSSVDITSYICRQLDIAHKKVLQVGQHKGREYRRKKRAAAAPQPPQNPMELSAAQKKAVAADFKKNRYKIEERILYNKKGHPCKELQIYNLGRNIKKRNPAVFSDVNPSDITAYICTRTDMTLAAVLQVAQDRNREPKKPCTSSSPRLELPAPPSAVQDGLKRDRADFFGKKIDAESPSRPSKITKR